MKHPKEILERYWGHTTFRPLQGDIIDAVLENEDVFCLLPTGGGKSVCFQIPALIKEGICIVISPLIALMKDQVQVLKNKGIKAVAITSGIPFNELDALLDNCIHGNYKFLYLSPERLQQSIVQERISQMSVNLIAVDEAHCISQWGHDFRPAYKEIAILRELHPTVNIIALTATAKKEVVEEIINNLDLLNPKIFKGSFNRENIRYIVKETQDKQFQLLSILKKNPGSSIIYVRSRRDAEDYGNFLKNNGIDSAHFHGGLDNTEKTNRLEDFLNDRISAVVATTAFGMGIDKSNVRNIIHVSLPESLESYYQESGRAGRDGLPSNAILLISNNDENRLRKQFIDNLPTLDNIKFVYKKLNSFFRIPYGEGEQSCHYFNFNQFCKAYNIKAQLAYNCIKILDRNGILKMNQQFRYQTKLQFIVSNQQLFKFLKSNADVQNITRTILRTYGGILEHKLNINIDTIAKKARTNERKVISVLNILEQEGMVDYEHNTSDTELIFLQPREDDKTINRISKTVIQNISIKTRHIDAVLNFVQDKSKCKNLILLNYFGQKTNEPCGKCSYCLNNKASNYSEPNTKAIRNSIIIKLESKPQSSRDLLNDSNIAEEMILEVLQELLEQDIVEITPSNKYKIKHTL